MVQLIPLSAKPTDPPQDATLREFDPEVAPSKATIKSVSRGAAVILVTHALRVGSMIRLIATDRMLLAEVVTCEPSGDQFEISAIVDCIVARTPRALRSGE